MLKPSRSLAWLIVAACTLAFGGAGCSADAVMGLPTVSADSLAALEADEAGVDREFSVLPLLTPDGYDQTVHPDYAMMPGWTPRRFLVATPYAFSDVHFENPSLYSQGPDHEWKPRGVNPLAISTSGYLSDPDMVAIEELNELWIYYREANKRNTIWLIRSSNGIDWGPRKKVVSAPRQMAVSPTVVRLSRNDWMMWSVNAGKDGCNGPSTLVELRRSSDGINWTPPTDVNLSQAPFFVWHIEVQWVPSRQEFWALYNVKRAGNCNTDLLFMATSPDGVTWKTYPSPILRAGVIPEFSEIVYRSTFAYNSRTDNIRFWFSGAHYADGRGYVWHTVYQKRKRSDVFATIEAQPQLPLSLRRGHEVPLLTNPP